MCSMHTLMSVNTGKENKGSLLARRARQCPHQCWQIPYPPYDELTVAAYSQSPSRLSDTSITYYWPNSRRNLTDTLDPAVTDPHMSECLLPTL